MTPEVKRLAVTVAPEKPEYRPGDSARVRVRVRDAQGHGARSEVTLWAVDEGVLSLTGYKTPDPIDLVYRERGLGLRLASNMTRVAPQVPEGTEGPARAGRWRWRGRRRRPSLALPDDRVLPRLRRHRRAGQRASLTAKLPDNLTTFRVMAVAVTAADRYGKGESSLLVTRPLLARQALPRFVRPGDQFTAGAVINRRDGAAVPVNVRAARPARRSTGSPDKTVTLAASRGAEVRFPFVATRVDSATFRFDVSGGGFADAVRVVASGAPGISSARSHARRRAARHGDGGARASRRHRPRALASLGEPRRVTAADDSRHGADAPRLSVLLLRAGGQRGDAAHRALPRAAADGHCRLLTSDPRGDIARAVDMLSRRQRSDGGIGYWSADRLDERVAQRLRGHRAARRARHRRAGRHGGTCRGSRDYLSHDLHATKPSCRRARSRVVATIVTMRLATRWRRSTSSAASVDPDVAAENELVRSAAHADAGGSRAAGRGAGAPQADRRGAAAHGADLGARAGRGSPRGDPGFRAHVAFYFDSYVRPIARILTATLAVDPQHALIGPLVETLVGEQDGAPAWMWNTQDYRRRRSRRSPRSIACAASSRSAACAYGSRDNSVLTAGAARDSSVALTGLLADATDGRMLRASLDAGPGDGVGLLLPRGDGDSVDAAGDAGGQGHSRRAVVRALRDRQRR